MPPSSAIGSSPSNGPSTRMRVRYQRGPAMSGSARHRRRRPQARGGVAADRFDPTSLRRMHSRSVQHPLPASRGRRHGGGRSAGVPVPTDRGRWHLPIGPSRQFRDVSPPGGTTAGRWRLRVVIVLVVGVAARARDRSVGFVDAPPHGRRTRDGSPWSATRSRFRAATRAILEVDGERFEHWARGARRKRPARGEVVPQATVCSSTGVATRSTPGAVCVWRGSTWWASSRSTGSPTRRRGTARRAQQHRPSHSRIAVLQPGSAAPEAALFRGLVRRRRPRPAASDDRSLPGQRAVASRLRCRVRTWRSCWRRLARCCGGCGRGAVGGHGRRDRLVRGAHAVRAVDHAGGGDGDAVGDCVRARPRRAPGGCCAWR